MRLYTLMWLSESLKKLLHQSFTLPIEHSFYDLRLGVEDSARHCRITSFWVGSAIHHPINLTPAQRSSAHNTWLDGDV